MSASAWFTMASRSSTRIGRVMSTGVSDMPSGEYAIANASSRISDANVSRSSASSDIAPIRLFVPLEEQVGPDVDALAKVDSDQLVPEVEAPGERPAPPE